MSNEDIKKIADALTDASKILIKASWKAVAADNADDAYALLEQARIDANQIIDAAMSNKNADRN